jgi:hypothetical protein
MFDLVRLNAPPHPSPLLRFARRRGRPYTSPYIETHPDNTFPELGTWNFRNHIIALRTSGSYPDAVMNGLPRKMKLQQSQVWKKGDSYLRIVRVERLAVDYKAQRDPNSKKGTHHHATKKEFCRLIKDATLLTDQEIFLTPPA